MHDPCCHATHGMVAGGVVCGAVPAPAVRRRQQRCIAAGSGFPTHCMPASRGHSAVRERDGSAEPDDRTAGPQRSRKGPSLSSRSSVVFGVFTSCTEWNSRWSSKRARRTGHPIPRCPWLAVGAPRISSLWSCYTCNCWACTSLLGLLHRQRCPGALLPAWRPQDCICDAQGVLYQKAQNTCGRSCAGHCAFAI